MQPPKPTRTLGIPLAAPTTATQQLYAQDWAAFTIWCKQQQRCALPASAGTLADFLLATPELSPGTLGRRRAAVGAMHRRAGLPVPRLDPARRKALRANRPTSTRTATPAADPAALVRVAARLPRDAAGLRDRALLLLLAATARQAAPAPPNAGPQRPRRAAIPRLALLALDAEHVRFTPDGAVLHLHAQEDAAPTLALARSPSPQTCPVRALEDWLRTSDTAFGPVFRKVDRWGNVEHTRLGRDAWCQILARHAGRKRRQAAPAA